MSQDTESEKLFAAFCEAERLEFARIPAGPGRTTDFRISVGGTHILIEIEQIESTKGIDPTGVSSRTVGDHVRSKILDARKQVQAAAREGSPTILLIYNQVDEPFQSFGTEPHDFIAAMYGEHTVRIVEGRVAESYHGRNATLRGKNTSFSAVGHLRRTESGAEIKIYENAYAKNPLPFPSLPDCIEVVRVEVPNAT